MMEVAMRLFRPSQDASPRDVRLAGAKGVFVGVALAGVGLIGIGLFPPRPRAIVAACAERAPSK